MPAPLCQACELRSATVDEPADAPSDPYQLCQHCHQRLMAMRLRPLEWFNLAKRHGWARFLLHDDFYDQDGTATQPEEEVESPERFPAPRLADAARSAETLLDFSITRWSVDEEVVEAWRNRPAAEVMQALELRLQDSRNPEVRAVVLQVASVMGPPAADLVRDAWTQGPERVAYGALVQATAACLPFEEGYGLAETALAAMPVKERRECFAALAYFRSPRVLRWIENHAAEPTVESWGRLAAASALDWPTVKNWLASGRPLSLIAIDALLAIAAPRTPLLRRLRPSLGEPASEDELRQALVAAAAVDPVPRMRQRIDALLELLPALTPRR